MVMGCNLTGNQFHQRVRWSYQCERINFKSEDRSLCHSLYLADHSAHFCALRRVRGQHCGEPSAKSLRRGPGRGSPGSHGAAEGPPPRQRQGYDVSYFNCCRVLLRYALSFVWSQGVGSISAANLLLLLIASVLLSKRNPLGLVYRLGFLVNIYLCMWTYQLGSRSVVALTHASVQPLGLDRVMLFDSADHTCGCHFSSNSS